MAAENTWYYQFETNVVGPIPASELRKLASISVIESTTFVRRGEDGEWVSADRVKGLEFPKTTEASGSKFDFDGFVESATKSVEPHSFDSNNFGSHVGHEKPPVRTVRSEVALPEYPWLSGYIVAMNVFGIIGNILAALFLFVGIAGLNFDLFVQGVSTFFGSNFLFVLASLTRLAIDARHDLYRLANR